LCLSSCTKSCAGSQPIEIATRIRASKSAVPCATACSTAHTWLGSHDNDEKNADGRRKGAVGAVPAGGARDLWHPRCSRCARSSLCCHVSQSASSGQRTFCWRIRIGTGTTASQSPSRQEFLPDLIRVTRPAYRGFRGVRSERRASYARLPMAFLLDV
jgi:hypothetical protein